MAVVGSAKIIVRAITDQVEGDIRRGFKGSDKVGGRAGKEIGDAMRKGINAGGGNMNFFSRVANGLKMIGRDSRGAYTAFAQLQRKFYSISTLLSGLIGGLFSLGGAAAALGGSVLGALPSLLALGNAMIALKLAGTVVGMAFKGVGAAVGALTAQNSGLAKSTADIRKEMKQLAFDAEAAALSERRASMTLEEARENLAMVQDLPPNSRVRREAELAYAEAELNMRRAMDQNKNAQEALEKGPDSGGGGGGVASAMEGLNKYQKAFARFLAGLKPKMDELRLIVSKNLLPPLQEALGTLVNRAFPTVKKGLGQIAGAVGTAAIAFVDLATKSGVLDAIGRIMKGMSKFLERFGTIAGNVFDAFIILLDAALPLLDTFGQFLIDSTGFIRDWLAELQASGELGAFLENAGKMAAILGDIFGNVFSALGSFISAAIGPGSPGEYLLTWIAEITQGWADAMSTDETKSGINSALMTAAINAQKFLQLIGGVFDVIATGLNTPNLGAFFDAISAALPSVQGMFEEAGSALPILGELIGNILEFLGAFTQTDAITNFFGILNTSAGFLADLMGTEVVQGIIGVVAPIHGVALAFGEIGDIAGKAFDVLKDGFGKLGEAMDFVVKHPILAILMALAALFIYLYTTNEDFRESIQNLFGKVMAAAMPIIEAVTDLLSKLFDNVGSGTGIMDMLADLFVQVFDMLASTLIALMPTIVLVMGIVGQLAQAFMVILEAVLPPLIDIITVLVPVVADLFAIFGSVVNVLVSQLMPVLGVVIGVIGGVLGPVLQIIGIIIAGLISAFGVITAVIKATVVPIFNVLSAVFAAVGIAAGAAGNTFKKVWDGLIGWFRGWVNAIIGYFQQFINFVISGLNRFFAPLRAAINGILTTLGIKFQFSVIPNVTLPRLAKGGIVMPSAGGSIVNIAEAGKPEKVVPLDAQGFSKGDRAVIEAVKGSGGVGGSPINMTINASEGMDVRELADEVSRRLAFAMRKGAIA